MPRQVTLPMTDTLSVPMPSYKFEAHGGSYGTTAHFEKSINPHMIGLGGFDERISLERQSNDRNSQDQEPGTDNKSFNLHEYFMKQT